MSWAPYQHPNSPARDLLIAIIYEVGGDIDLIMERAGIDKRGFYWAMKNEPWFRDHVRVAQAQASEAYKKDIKEDLMKAIRDSDGYPFVIMMDLGIGKNRLYRLLKEFPEAQDLLEEVRNERELSDDYFDAVDYRRARDNRSKWIHDEESRASSACVSSTMHMLSQMARSRAQQAAPLSRHEWRVEDNW